MTCIKTGAHVWLEPYGEFVWCDAHEFGPWQDDEAWRRVIYKLTPEERGLIKTNLVLRIVGRSFAPINNVDVIHYIVHDWQEWFNRDSTVMAQHPSTLISNNWKPLGYYGTPIEKALDRLTSGGTEHEEKPGSNEPDGE